MKKGHKEVSAVADTIGSFIFYFLAFIGSSVLAGLWGALAVCIYKLVAKKLF